MINSCTTFFFSIKSFHFKYEFCRYFTPQPKFFYLENLDGITCRVILPPNAPFRQVDSCPCSSKDEAKRVASLQACITLHERGALSNYLLPDHGKGTRKANASECEENEGLPSLHNYRLYVFNYIYYILGLLF